MEQIVKNIINNWYLVVACISIVICAIVYVVNFFQKPTSEQLATLKSWILYMVVEAEKALGSGTGKLKLRYVYDKFAARFPYLVKYLSFDKFSELVDEALEEMKKLINSNKYIQEYVGVEPTPIEGSSSEE